MSALFSPFSLRGVTFRNRIGVSPMCMYSADDGMPTLWHTVHLGSRAVGGAGLVCAEATAVSPEGRISPGDLGIWSDDHAEALSPIVSFMAEHGAVPGIQLAHAGRKASTPIPWIGRAGLTPQEGGWTTLAPSPTPFGPDSLTPQQMDADDIAKLIADFVAAAIRSVAVGFRYLECHFAHGYLLHEFMSPLANSRDDTYGGPLENRARLMLDIAAAVRASIRDGVVLAVRLSVTDWIEGGVDIEETVTVCRWLKDVGVDLIDCSSGAIIAQSVPPQVPGVHVPFSERIRRDAAVATAAVSGITEARQAEDIIAGGQADLVLLARAMLRDPYWPHHAAMELDADDAWPPQYARAIRTRRKPPETTS